jgi:hypothetical protein
MEVETRRGEVGYQGGLLETVLWCAGAGSMCSGWEYGGGLIMVTWCEAGWVGMKWSKE